MFFEQKQHLDMAAANPSRIDRVFSFGSWGLSAGDSRKLRMWRQNDMFLFGATHF